MVAGAQVVPVLATYADATLPEQLGTIHFVQRLIGRVEPPAPLTAPADALAQRIADAISRSEIDLVRRLTGGARDLVVGQVVRVAQKGNLYGTQLDAFCAALQYSVHCTQVCAEMPPRCRRDGAEIAPRLCR